MKRVLFKFRFVSLVFFAVVAGGWPMAAQAAAPGPAAGFAVLSAAPNGLGHVDCTTSTVKGDVGSTGAVANTGCVITGNTIAPVSAGVVSDFNSAYSALKSVPCDHTLATLDVTQTLTPGVYCFAAGATATSKVLTLNGPANGIWLFKIGTGGTGALTGTDFSVVMTGGGQPCNVNWWAAQAATLTVDNGKTVLSTPFSGNILAGAAATVTGTAGATSALTLTGRVWAGAGVTVTDSNIVGCTAGIPVPGQGCKEGNDNNNDNNNNNKNEDGNSHQSNDAADHNKSVKSAKHTQHGDENCDSEKSKKGEDDRSKSKD